MSDSKLEEIRKKRAARQAELKAAWEEQRAIDLEAVFALEEQHGASNITIRDVEHTPGLPTLIAARCPDKNEIKRFRDRLKKSSRDNDGKSVDYEGACEEIGACCRVYPDDETYKRLLDARPGIHVPLGAAAVALAGVREAAEGKA